MDYAKRLDEIKERLNDLEEKTYSLKESLQADNNDSDSLVCMIDSVNYYLSQALYCINNADCHVAQVESEKLGIFDLFVVTRVNVNEIGIIPNYETFDGEWHNIYFKGSKADCEAYLERLCDSCCQLYNGEKTSFCESCENHKWYVHK